VIYSAFVCSRKWFITSSFNLAFLNIIVLNIHFSFVQACPKLIDRFKEREENVKVSLDLSIAEI
jgi:hypothetical protein